MLLHAPTTAGGGFARRRESGSLTLLLSLAAVIALVIGIIPSTIRIQRLGERTSDPNSLTRPTFGSRARPFSTTTTRRRKNGVPPPECLATESIYLFILF